MRLLAALTAVQLSALSLSVAPAQAEGAYCDGVLFGEQLPKIPFALKWAASYEIWLIDSGRNGSIYRLKARDGSHVRIIKIYKATSDLQHDLLAYAILQEVFNGRSDVVVVKMKKIGRRMIELDNIYGESLMRLYERRQLDESVKSQYISVLRYAEQKLRFRFGDKVDMWTVFSDSKKGAALYAHFQETKTSIFLKLDNFLTSPHAPGKIFLVDPH